MIDFHTHILPGIDDGPIDVSESIVMAARLSEFGYKTVCCTPHCIKGYYDITPQKVREATLMLQADLDNADIHLELWPGIEYCLDDYLPDYAEDLLPLGPTRLVLCEAPQQANHEIVQAGLKLIAEKGYVPFVAHPERTEYFYEMILQEKGGKEAETIQADNHPHQVKPKSFWGKLFNKKESVPVTANSGPLSSNLNNVLFHANLGSFTGFYGPKVQSHAYDLLKLNAYTGIATDLHDSASTQGVLKKDKLAMNPLLKKMSGFNGVVNIETKELEVEEQGSLF